MLKIEFHTINHKISTFHNTSVKAWRYVKNSHSYAASFLSVATRRTGNIRIFIARRVIYGLRRPFPRDMHKRHFVKNSRRRSAGPQKLIISKVSRRRKVLWHSAPEHLKHFRRHFPLRTRKTRRPSLSLPSSPVPRPTPLSVYASRTSILCSSAENTPTPRRIPFCSLRRFGSWPRKFR